MMEGGREGEEEGAQGDLACVSSLSAWLGTGPTN